MGNGAVNSYRVVNINQSRVAKSLDKARFLNFCYQYQTSALVTFV